MVDFVFNHTTWNGFSAGKTKEFFFFFIRVGQRDDGKGK